MGQYYQLDNYIKYKRKKGDLCSFYKLNYLC